MAKKIKKRRKRSAKKILKDKIWTLLSKCIRLRAADESGFVTCYTCGAKVYWKSRKGEKRGAQAGHALGDRTNSKIFDEDIIRVQCYTCNIMKHGNYVEFTARLIEENGLEWWQNKLFESKKSVKFTMAELQEKYNYYKNELDKLEKLKEA